MSAILGGNRFPAGIVVSGGSGALLGLTSVHADLTNYTGGSQLWCSASGNVHAALHSGANAANGARLHFLKSRATNGSADTVLQSSDVIGEIEFVGADGAAYRGAARIRGVVDTTPGSGDMPGRLEVATSADGGVTPLTRWSIDSSGNLNQDATNGGDVVFSKSADTGVRTNTSDAADNRQVQIQGGGAFEAIGTTNRGAKLILHGNEHGTAPGEAYLEANGVVRVRSATAAVQLRGASHTIAAADGSTRWSVDSSANLNQDGTNGGDLVMAKASTSIRQTFATSLTAAGSSISDALQLTAAINNVTTVAASTGVKLYNAGTGAMVVVKNRGANNLNVYPPDGSGTIDGGAGGAAVVVATNATGLFFKMSSTNWISVEAGSA